MSESVEKIYEEVLPPMEKIQENFYETIKNRLTEQGKSYKFVEYRDLSYLDAIKREYDVTSPKQLGDIMMLLFKNRSVTGFDVELTLTGEEGSLRRQVATATENIEAYVKTHGHLFPFLKRVNVYRTLQKVLGTYIKPLIENTNPKDSTTRFSFNAFTVDTGRFSASKGNVEAGYSGINVQSMPACYSTAKFPCRVVESRPSGAGYGALTPSLLDAITKRGFIRRIYDGHFMLDIPTGKELCVRVSCEGCPFEASCVRGATQKKRVVSLESSARLGIVARDKDHILVASDESGVELRVAANASREPKWVEEFFRCASCGYSFDEEKKLHIAPPSLCPSCESDKIGDLHTLTCQIVYGADIVNAPDFKTYRQASKGANFALLYGGGPGAVKAATNLSDDESRAFRDKFLAGLPVLNRWFKTTIEYARKHKEVSTLLGRKIRLPDIDNPEGFIRSKAERNAINSIIQGSATGDLTKYAMARAYNALKTMGPDALEDCKLILTVHDELVFDIKKSRLDEFVPLITGIMTELSAKLKWSVPLKCDVELGPSWDVIYNWDGMHSASAKTGMAHEPVPEELVDYIKHLPGMWVYDAEGNEKPLVGRVSDGSDIPVVSGEPVEGDTSISHKWDSSVYTLDARSADPQAMRRLMNHIQHFCEEKGIAGKDIEGVSIILEDSKAQEMWKSNDVLFEKSSFELLMQFLVHLQAFDPLRN
jgi:DNA polymerase I-like protein with 3'-5' exonuclease and polymerase domains